MTARLGWLDKSLSRLLVALVAAIVLCVCWQVLSRYVTQTPSAYSEELARFLLIWLGLLGAAYAYRTGAHLGLDLVVNQMTERGQRYVGVFVHCVVLVFAVAVMIVGGIRLMMLAIDPGQVSSALELNMAWVYGVLPLSGIVISIYAVAQLLNDHKEQC